MHWGGHGDRRGEGGCRENGRREVRDPGVVREEGRAGPHDGGAGGCKRCVVHHLVGKVKEAELDDAQQHHKEKRYDDDEFR